MKLKRRISIGIAEDHILVRKGIVEILNKFENVTVLFEVSDGKELLERLREVEPHIILLDIKMPGVGGLDAMKEIKIIHPNVKIVVISAYDDQEDIIDYVKKGANAFLPKNCSVASLATTIKGVYKNGLHFEDDTLKSIAQIKHRELTQREIVILKLFCAETPYEKIAEMMEIDLKTVKWYLRKLMLKTNTKDVSDLLMFAKKKSY